MARGGRRTYTRDSRGRFSSTPGGGLGAARKAARSQSGRASTLGARTSLRASRAKLRAKDPADQRLSTALSTRAQKGAVTRGSRGLKAAKAAAQTRIAGGRKGVIGKTRKAPKVADANPLKQVRRNRKRGPMTERLRVALEVSSKIASKKQVAANKASKELADRRFISRFILAKSGKAAKLAGSKKEDAARVKSAQATKSWQKAEKRADTLLEAYRNRIAAIKKAAPGKLRPGQTKALTRKNTSGVIGTSKKSSQEPRKPAASADKSASPPSRAKGSRARLPGIGGTIAKPKGLKPGALAERRAAKAQKPINISPTRKPRKSKYQLQIVDQANRILDKLKLRMVTNAKGFNRYNLEDRIAKVNKIAKTAIPGYRHNPMRKNSSAKSAYQERNRRYGKAATAARNIARGSEFFRYGRYID